MAISATPPQGGVTEEDEFRSLAFRALVDGPATDDILLKGFTRHELDWIEAAAFRDGYSDVREWCKDIIFSIARLN